MNMIYKGTPSFSNCIGTFHVSNSVIYIYKREEEDIEVTIVIYSKKNGALKSEREPMQIFCVIFAAVYRVFDSSIEWLIGIRTDWKRRNKAGRQLGL